jgi:HlyD family type I secretion membrane fusion protein
LTDHHAYSREAAEFLPGTAQLSQRPLNPILRIIPLVIIMLVTAFIIWAILGRLDIVSVAHGRLIPAGKIRTVQSLDRGVIQEILVADGDEVQRGQALVVIDASSLDAQQLRIESEILSHQQAIGRIEQLLNWAQQDINGAGRNRDGPLPGLAKSLEQQAVIEQRYSEFKTRMLALRHSLEEKQHEGIALAQEHERHELMVENVSQRLEAIRELVRQQLAAEQDRLPLEKELIDHEQQAKIATRRIDEVRAGVNRIRQQLASETASFQARLLEEKINHEDAIRVLEASLQGIVSHGGQYILRSPVNGLVEHMQINTVGGVVSPADEILSVIPIDEGLEIEAWVMNHEVGFVEQGQVVTVKVDAFPFTRHGTLSGTIIKLGKDAQEIADKGWVFPVRIGLDQEFIEVNRRQIPLSPGMSVQAEILTGQRQIIDYFLSPIQVSVSESLHER